MSLSERPLALTLLPCGAVDQAELNSLARALSAKGMYVTVATERPVPLPGLESRHQQYRADEFLEVARNEPGDRVLAVTNCDLYVGRSQLCLRLS